MTSQKQLEANRRNAQRSTGPKTAEGKVKASRNNIRHGLTGQITVLPSEDREAHDGFIARFVDSLAPETAFEEHLAHSIAEDSWRLNRICAIETNIFALGRGHERRDIQCALADAQTFLDHAGKFSLLGLYEQRISRNMQKNIAELHKMQAERRESLEKEMDKENQRREHQLEEAKLLAQASLINGSAFDPTANGFEFSAAEINRAIDRDNRLKDARELASNPQKQPSRPQPLAARAA